MQILWRMLLVPSAFGKKIGRLKGKIMARAYFPGKGTILDGSTVLKWPDRIRMGRDVWIGPQVSLGALGGITFGDKVRISYGAFVETGGLNLEGEAHYVHKAKPISVGNGVWIGAHSIILGGATLGDGAVVAAGAVVTRDVPENAIVAGIPAKVVGYRPGTRPSATPILETNNHATNN